MGIWKLFADDFKRMYSDFIKYIKPPPIVTAEEFIAEFEKAQEEKYNSKDETLKRLGLDKVSCRLSTEDLYGINDSDAVETKYQTLQRYLEEREKFEREWR